MKNSSCFFLRHGVYLIFTMIDLASLGEYELFSHLYNKIISREIHTFSQLKEYAEQAAKTPKFSVVLMRAFQLIKQLNWGFFSNISRNTHPDLWRELVITDRDFPEAGDLKRSTSIPNLFVALLDIHGYTKFCQAARKNLSLLKALDQVIGNDVKTIAEQCHCISRRERGEEIVIVSASAVDAITAALSIIDYFSRVRKPRSPEVKLKRSKYAEALPVFKISGGVSGGNTSIPLIITENGDFSGFLLNTAARLQSRANELSSKNSRLMLTKQVRMKAEEEIKTRKDTIFQADDIFFFDTGLLEFKGVMLPTCELVFDSASAHKRLLADDLQELHTAIRSAQWEEKVFSSVIKLFLSAAEVMEHFSIMVNFSGVQEQVTTSSFQRLCCQAYDAYVKDENYPRAVKTLRQCILVLEQLPDTDRSILDYAWDVLDRYSLIMHEYEASFEQETDKHLSGVFDEHQMKTYVAARHGAAIYEKMREVAQKHSTFDKKKKMWHSLIAQRRENMTLTIYSGKK